MGKLKNASLWKSAVHGTVSYKFFCPAQAFFWGQACCNGYGEFYSWSLVPQGRQHCWCRRCHCIMNAMARVMLYHSLALQAAATGPHSWSECFRGAPEADWLQLTLLALLYRDLLGEL